MAVRMAVEVGTPARSTCTIQLPGAVPVHGDDEGFFVEDEGGSRATEVTAGEVSAFPNNLAGFAVDFRYGFYKHATNMQYAIYSTL